MSSSHLPTSLLAADADSRAFRPCRHVIARKLPDRTVLLNGTTGACFELNGVGSTVWDQLDGARSWNDIADEVARRFNLAAATALADVNGFARMLTAANLIEPASS